MSPPIHHTTRNRLSGFSLVEVVVAILVTGAILGLVMTSLVMLDHAVANEKAINIGEYHSSLNSDWWHNMGYWDLQVPGGTGPAFSIAPSRAADAKAQSLWREVRDLYEQSTSVVVMPVYVIADFSSNPFSGHNGFFSQDKFSSLLQPLSYSQIINWAPLANWNVPNNALPSNSSLGLIFSRFSGQAQYWGDGTLFPAGDAAKVPTDAQNLGKLGIDPNSYRAATVFFIAPPCDRLIGMLRMRAYQFKNSSDPYRYYEVSVASHRWDILSFGKARASIYNPGRYTEDYVYRFVEDKLYPQDLIFPPTKAELTTIAGGGDWPNPNAVTTDDPEPRNEFIRLAAPGEDYTPNGGTGNEWANNTNTGVSRRQVSLAPQAFPSGSTPVLTAGVDEWHLILPDPGINQAEERANLRSNPNNWSGSPSAPNLTNDYLIRRQGKYGCVMSVYP